MGREMDRGPMSDGGGTSLGLKKLAIETLFFNLGSSIGGCRIVDDEEGMGVWGRVVGDGE
jgi:hypothetical protein